MNTQNNPFKQAKHIFCVEFETTYQFLNNFIPICEKFSDNIVFFEKDGSRSIESMPEDLWQIQIYFQNKPDFEELNNELLQAAKSLNIQTPETIHYLVEDIDWVSEVQKNFNPIISGKFFIHNSTTENKAIDGKISIEINAGRAFGTGEHATTSNCLAALSKIDNFGTCLDMGCGSGILAIAMKKLGAKKVIAVDLDEQAVEVTKENLSLNKLTEESITTAQSHGFNSSIVKENGPYDIITANILALPLIEMAEDAFTSLNHDGIIILAGFINSQVQDVSAAYEKAGFKLNNTIEDDNWPVLVYRK